jgi:antagonist of KipI
MSFLVLESGLHSLIVDFGRPATRSLGMPVGGAADRLSLALGNRLVGNSPNTPALEITLAGPTLSCDTPTSGVLFGAPFSLHSDRQSLVVGKTFLLEVGEQMRIGGTPHGLRAYLCVPGGFDSPAVLDSRSALQPIRQGDSLDCAPSALPIRSLAHDSPSSLPAEDPVSLRFLPGAQSDWFDTVSFAAQLFQVTPASDRMGLRLKGEPLPRPAREIISEPVCPGTVQVTNDGQCIILGVEGQTIGGYPKIAQVILADLDLVGQLRPGTLLRFTPVTFEQAETADREKAGEKQRWLARLAAVID